MAYRDYSTAKGHIVDPNGFGDFTTLTAASTAASAGSVIFIRPGTYAESFTAASGVAYFAYPGGFASSTGQVIITGAVVIQNNVTFSNIYFSPVSSTVPITISGSNSLTAIFNNCQINNNGAAGIVKSNSNAVSSYNNCNFAVLSNNAFFTISAGTPVFNYCTQNISSISNVTASTFSGSALYSNYCLWQTPLTTSSTAQMWLRDSTWDLHAGQNTTCLIAGATGAINYVYRCSFYSGTASCISISTGAKIILASSTLDTSNTNALTGAGTVNTGGNVCTNSGTGNNVTTINHLTVI